MYVYKYSTTGIYTVGFYEDGGFMAETEHDNVKDAAARVHYLNGGDPPITLEKAALMIAQGYVANCGFVTPDPTLAEYCVSTAKAVIEECNK